MKKFYVLPFALLLFAACASDKDADMELSAEDLYNKAWEDLNKTKYDKAAGEFEKVETDHPYSQWAVKAKLMGAYAYYKNEKYDDAVLALDRFIKYHPGNEDAPYAYYLKGMCYYDQITSADKDQSDTEKAEETFRLLTEMYPDSKYAADARGKINLAEDYRAGQEMKIARFYLHDGNYLSALNRFNTVLENYQTTAQIEEALYREVELYSIFGMNKYAEGYYRILRDNYPDGVWTAKAEKLIEKINKNKAAKSAKKEVKSTDMPEAKAAGADEESVWDKMKFWKDDKTDNQKAKAKSEKETVISGKNEIKSEYEENIWDKMKFWKDEEAADGPEVKAEPEKTVKAEIKTAEPKKSIWGKMKFWNDDETAAGAEAKKESEKTVKAEAKAAGPEKSIWDKMKFWKDDDKTETAGDGK